MKPNEGVSHTHTRTHKGGLNTARHTSKSEMFAYELEACMTPCHIICAASCASTGLELLFPLPSPQRRRGQEEGFQERKNRRGGTSSSVRRVVSAIVGEFGAEGLESRDVGKGYGT